MIGTQLAHYSITSHLGSGGMGEVYEAMDSKLGRRVAIKLLPESFARDTERAARLEREARVLAALNHPNIAAVHGLEEAEHRQFLVMELVEGETLAERIRRGPLPIDEALTICLQLCEALEAAHEKGVIHRDLKPANVKITPAGTVKALDFGLAKTLDRGPSNTMFSNSPTMSLAGTVAGVILGTAAYMSPEQAKGAEADQRSDIFSFGCVLYEMLTGRQAFEGDSVSEILAAVLKSEPDLSLLPENLDPRIRQLLKRMLEKKVRRPWYAIGDVRVEMEGILASPPAPALPPLAEQQVSAPLRPVWRRAIPVVLGTLLAGVIVESAVWKFRPKQPSLVVRSTFPLREGQNFSNPGRQLLALSSDGSQMVYVANQRL